MAEYASRGVGNAGLTTGIIGSALGALNSNILPILFGGGNCCSENQAVSRYELGMEKSNADLKSENALLKANIYNDQKSLEMYQYVDGRFRGIEAQLAQQAVTNAQISANISCMQGTIDCLTSLTKTVVPITNICPQPMPQYNSWTAPTTTETTTG